MHAIVKEIVKIRITVKIVHAIVNKIVKILKKNSKKINERVWRIVLSAQINLHSAPFFTLPFFRSEKRRRQFCGRYLDYLEEVSRLSRLYLLSAIRARQGLESWKDTTLRKTNKGVSEWYETTCNDTLWYTM